MIRFLKSLVLLPIAALVILLAVANRAPVQLSFDPFNADAPVFSVSLPLYAILFGAVALGIVVGGIGKLSCVAVGSGEGTMNRSLASTSGLGSSVSSRSSSSDIRGCDLL